MEDVVRGVDPAFWRGRRVLVTGNTGFKGSWLSSWLLELGAEVGGFALPPKGERPLFKALRLDERSKHVDGDIRDLTVVSQAIRQFEPEIVIHLAAQALVRMSYDDPKTTFDTNFGGGLNLLEAIRGAPSVRACVFITSDKCYENRDWAWGYRETDALGGSDPYSASKAAAELMVASYRDSFFSARKPFGIATARAGNVIGGGDWSADRIIPDCIRALCADRPIVIRHPNATRPWQHVLEPLSGYLILAQRLIEDPDRSQGAWNFGPLPDRAMPVRTLANLAVELWGRGEVIVGNEQGPPEHQLLQLAIDKAWYGLGWRPRWSTERAIAKTVQWYRDVETGQKPTDVTSAQIAAYMAGV